MARWFEHGNFWWLSPIPLMTAGVALALWRSSDSSRSDAWPSLLTLAIFVLGFIGLVLGM